VSKILLGAAAAAAMILATSGASATGVTLGNITVFDYGQVSATAPDFAQPGVPAPTAQIEIGQVTGPGNLPPLDNPGWDPFGLSDTTHHWWNVEGGSVTMNGSGNALTIVWGSPNDNNPAATNTVSFYSGANGTGSLIGSVRASDLYSNFAGINNTQDPGYLISFVSDQTFGSVVFTTGSSDFEFAAVPEPSTWAMLGIGFAGLALGGYKRSRRDRLAPALG
jgi:PEP-CTERM motif